MQRGKEAEKKKKSQQENEEKSKADKWETKGNTEGY